MKYLQHYDSVLGGITMESDGEALTGLWFDCQQPDFEFESNANMEKQAELPVFQQTVRWLDVYFAGNIPDFRPELQAEGSRFRQLIWELLLAIPYGQTLTYGQLAKEAARLLGRERMSAQAIGGAVGHNPISLIIPCHRVIGANGNLVGYAGGVDLKARLLELEHDGLEKIFKFHIDG